MSIFDALMGKTDFKARAPVINTRAGQAAIKSQLTSAGQQANALGYSLAASGRGAGSGLALREAQRRGAQAINTAGAQAGMLSQQLEQSAMQTNANNQMQAQQINAGIAQSNAQGLQKLVGAGAQGFAMGMTGGLSDERAKQGIQVMGPYRGSTDAELLASGQYGSQTAGYDDGRRVMWAAQDPRQQAEAEHNIAVARERGIQLGGQDVASLQGAAPAPPPVQPRAPAPATGQQPAAPAPQGGFAAGLGRFGEVLSDARSKQRIVELESTIRGLTSKLASAMTPAPAKPAAKFSKPVRPPVDARNIIGGGMDEEATLASLRRQPVTTQYPTLDVTERVPGGTMKTASEPLSAEEQARLDATVSDRGAKHVSDKNAKITNYLQPVRPVSYDYKPGVLQAGEGDPGRQYGLLAQDLARTPEGRSVVERGPDGLLRVQIPQLALMNTAADAEQQREIDRLKKKVG